MPNSDELEAKLQKLLELRQLYEEKEQAERGTFRQRYPTPGALATALQPKMQRQTPALEAIDRELVALADGEISRLQIFMAPQEGKSSRVSNWYPLWRLGSDPTLRIAIVSYSARKAERWGRWIRRMIQQYPSELGIELMSDSRAVDRFEFKQGGSVICVGLEGGITGEPVDDMYLDDPIRGRAEAESPYYRDSAWDWWENNGATRLSERGRVVLMMTRWNQDDLAGRLLKNEPNEWRVLRIAAVREPGDPDIFGNDGKSAYHPNGELISVRGRHLGYFLDLKAKRSPYVWRSIYRQDPVAATGNLFHRDDFQYWYSMPRDPGRHDELGGARIDLGDRYVFLGECYRFVTVDLAVSKKTSSDWTVAAAWAVTGDGDLVLLDRLRERMGEEAHWRIIHPLLRKFRIQDAFVEKGFIGSTLTIDATRAGVAVQPVTPDKDKITRALAATYRVRAHRVWFPASADWLDIWLDELSEFPNGAHDDQVDTLSYAARVASANWLPEESIPTPRSTDPTSPVETAYQSATGIVGIDSFRDLTW
jgi:predicted phage terminase large subunit-like protein